MEFGLDAEEYPDPIYVSNIASNTSKEKPPLLEQLNADRLTDNGKDTSLPTEVEHQHLQNALSVPFINDADGNVDLEKQQLAKAGKRSKHCDSPYCEYCAMIPLAIFRALAVASLPTVVLIYGLPICDEHGHAFFMAYLISWAFYSGSVIQYFTFDRFRNDEVIRYLFLWPIAAFTFWSMLNSDSPRLCANDQQ